MDVEHKIKSQIIKSNVAKEKTNHDNINIFVNINIKDLKDDGYENSLIIYQRRKPHENDEGEILCLNKEVDDIIEQYNIKTDTQNQQEEAYENEEDENEE